HELLQLRESAAVNPAVLLEAVLCALLELVEVPARLGYADHGHVEGARLHHGLKAGEDLLVREVARRPEEDERVGRGRHGRDPNDCGACASACPARRWRSLSCAGPLTRWSGSRRRAAACGPGAAPFRR